VSREIEQFGWLLEELRVSSSPGAEDARVPVSVKAVSKLWHSMRK
jgi:hypothetical protein